MGQVLHGSAKTTHAIRAELQRSEASVAQLAKRFEAELNLPIAVDGSHYTDPDFMPSWEWIIDHSGLFEAVFIMTDDGYGHVLLVPDADGIDPALLTLCRTYADKSDDPPTG